MSLPWRRRGRREHLQDDLPRTRQRHHGRGLVLDARGYSATDGKSYNVLTLLHGVPGTADGIVPGLDLGTQLQAAIDDGRLPPTIVAVPSLNADAAQRSSPDCADIIGRAKVGTWIQEDVPRMIRATFPGVRKERQAWPWAGLLRRLLRGVDCHCTLGRLCGSGVLVRLRRPR